MRSKFLHISSSSKAGSFDCRYRAKSSSSFIPQGGKCSSYFPLDTPEGEIFAKKSTRNRVYAFCTHPLGVMPGMKFLILNVCYHALCRLQEGNPRPKKERRIDNAPSMSIRSRCKFIPIEKRPISHRLWYKSGTKQLLVLFSKKAMHARICLFCLNCPIWTKKHSCTSRGLLIPFPWQNICVNLCNLWTTKILIDDEAWFNNMRLVPCRVFPTFQKNREMFFEYNRDRKWPLPVVADPQWQNSLPSGGRRKSVLSQEIMLPVV